MKKEDEIMFARKNKKQKDTFAERVLKADLRMRANFNEIKNELLSYGVNSEIDEEGAVFFIDRKRYAWINIVDKTLLIYLAINPKECKMSCCLTEDVGYRSAFVDIPLLFKVTSPESVNKCKEYIKNMMEKDGLSKNCSDDVSWSSEMLSRF